MALTANFPDIVGNLGVNGFSGGNRARAAEVNANVLEPLLYLKARPVARFVDLDGTVFNTTSTSFVDVTGASASITTSRSSRLLIIGHVMWGQSASFANVLTIDIDGSAQGDASNGVISHNAPSTGGIPAGSPAAFTWLTAAAVSDGAHTVKLRMKVQGGTGTIYGVNGVILEVN
jgi:hypothetical protein